MIGLNLSDPAFVGSLVPPAPPVQTMVTVSATNAAGTGTQVLTITIAE